METTKSTKVISLNGLTENHECIFKHIVKNNTVLNKYLECLRDDEPSLTKVTDDILKTLIDAAGDDTNVLARILKQASKSLSIDDIDPVLSLCARAQWPDAHPTRKSHCFSRWIATCR